MLEEAFKDWSDHNFFLGRRRRPYIVFRNRFLYGFMFVYIYIYIKGVKMFFTKTSRDVGMVPLIK